MKLHLPLPLRSALLAVCAVVVSHTVQAATVCGFSATLGNVMQSQTLNSDLSYDDGILEKYEVHAGTDQHEVRNNFPYDAIGSRVTTKSVHSFGVSVYHKDTSTPVQRIPSEVDFSLDGNNRNWSYEVRIGEEKGNVAWIIPYEKGTVKMREMDDILISGTNYSNNGGTDKNWDTPFHERPTVTDNYSNAYINCLDITISDSNTFTFEKGDHSKKAPKQLGALTTDGSLTLTNVDQVSLNDNIGRVMVGSIFTWENVGTGVGTFRGNKDVIFYDKSGVTIKGVEQVDFANNENTIFKDALVNQVIFKEIETLVFSGNGAETGVITEGGTSRSENASYSNVVGDMIFEDVSTLKFTENTATKEYLFTYLIPRTRNCGEIYITNNTAEQGSVLCGVEGTSVSLNLENTKKGLHINKNTASYDEDYSKAVLVKGNITASGSSEKEAVFEMNKNTGNGTFTDLLGGTLTLSSFASASISDNVITTTTSGSSIAGTLAISDIGSIVIANNVYETTAGTGNLVSGKVSDFGSLSITGNTYGYDASTKETIKAKNSDALLSGLTVTGRAAGSTVTISNNKIGSGQNNKKAGASSFSSLKSLEIGNNSAYNSAILGSVALTNVAEINVQGNTITDDKISGWNGYTCAVLSGVSGNNIGNEKIVIKNNTVQSYSDAHGAAIEWGKNQGMTLTSSHVEVSGNKSIGTTSAGGAALWLDDESSSYHPMVFEDCGTISITNNGSQSDDITNVKGGAIHTTEDLEFRNNESVELRGNYVRDTSGENCHLNAIYFDDYEAELRIKAGAGQTFTSYDGIYVQDDLCINGDEEDQSTAYTGTVTFSGVHAKEDLAKLKSNYTEAELEASKTVHTDYRAKVYRGTLVLDHSILEVNREYDIYWSTALLPQATPHFESTQDALLVMKGAEIRTKAMLNLTIPTYGLSSIAKADFSESNVIDAVFLNAEGGTWTFRLSEVNKETPVLRIEFTEDGAGLCALTTTNMTFDIRSASSNFTKGKYILLSFNTENGSWDTYGDVTLTGLAKSSSIGESKGEGDVYFVQQGTERQLIFESAEDIVSHRGNTTLTWGGGNGVWGNEVGGGVNPTWTADVEDVNFYTGDGVVFKNAANVTIEGTVRPGSVLVENAAGQDVTFGGGGQITDVDIPSKQVVLTKRGEGKLTINTANAYTGGTVVEAGTLVTGNANALGVGGVTLNGGTLDMGGQAVGNTVTVKKAASITNGGAYTGKLTLDGGTLSGAVNLAQDAELKNGTVAGILSGKGGVVVKDGAVTLSGENTYTGKTMVQSGTLTVSGSVASKQIEVQSGGTYSGTLVGPDLTVTLAGGTLKGDVTLDGGVLNSTEEGSTVDGRLNLAQGGKLGVTEGAGLSVKELVADGGELGLTPDNSGHLSVDTFTTSNKTTVKVGDDLLGLGAGTYELLTYGTLGSGSSAGALELAGLSDLHTRKDYALELGEKSLTLTVSGGPEQLTWDSASTNTWSNEDTSGEWSSEAKDKHFYDGDLVTFDSAGDVTIEGTVTPGSITVQGDGNTTFKNAVDKTGALAGKATLTKEGAGTLDIQTDNDAYSGNIVVNGGTLRVGHDHALGRGKVFIANARFDGAGRGISNQVTLSGNSRLKGASGVTNLTFASGSRITGEDGYTLSADHTLTIDSTGKARSAENPGSSYSGTFTFAGGTLKLNGGAFDLSDATVKFADGSKSIIDLSEWGGLDDGNEHTIAQLKEGDETFAEHFKVTMDPQIQSSAHIEVRGNGEVVLVMENPGDNPGGNPGGSPTVAATLTRDQAAAYSVLAQIASGQLATGTLAEAANLATTGNPEIIDQLSGAEIATAISSQMEGNLAHLRRLRTTIGSGQTLSSESSLAAFISAYDDFTSMQRDYNGRGYNRTEYGGVFGMETRLEKHTLLGLALSAGRARVAPSGAQERYHEDTYRQDLYLVTNIADGLRSTTTVGVGEHKFNMHRAGYGLVSSARDMKGNSFNFSEEIAVTLSSGETGSFETFFSLESTYSHIKAFHESGAGTASISADAHEAWATDLSLGVRANLSFTLMGNVPAAMLSMQAALVSSVGDTGTDVTMRYAGAPDLPYSVRAAKRNRWGYSLGASLTVPVNKGTAIIGSAETVLRGDSHETTGSVGIRMSF